MNESANFINFREGIFTGAQQFSKFIQLHNIIFGNHWLRMILIWRIMQIQEDVITPASEICIRAVVSVHRLRALATLIGQLHLISVPSPPPVEDLPFLLTPEDWLKLQSPEHFHKVYPWRITPWRIWVYTWRISWKLRLHPQRIQYFLTPPLKKSSIFITDPWRIPWLLNRGGGGGGY